MQPLCNSWYQHLIHLAWPTVVPSCMYMSTTHSCDTIVFLIYIHTLQLVLQIARTRQCFEDAEAGVNLLDPSARWPVWSALILYRQILDAIEANDYDNFTKRAYVPKWRKMLSLPAAFANAVSPQLLQTRGNLMAVGSRQR